MTPLAASFARSRNAGARDAVGAEAREIPAHLLDLAMDERAFGVARPLDEGVRIGRADPGQLPGEVEVAARVPFLGDDADAVLLARLDERIEPALAEIVVDVKEAETLEVRHFLVDEVDHVADQLAVRDRRAEHPFVALRCDALGGSAHDDLRHLLLAKHLRGGEARRAAHAADGERHLIAGREASRHHGRLLGLAGVVADHDLDRATEQAAGRILDVHRHLDAFAHRSGLARRRCPTSARTRRS